jgi:CubicO group peptidase (beta-lactamase class C family)
MRARIFAPLEYLAVLVLAAAIGIVLATVTMEAAAATREAGRPRLAPVLSDGRLSDEVLQIAARLQKAPPLDAPESDTPSPRHALDAHAPGVGLPRAIAQLERLRQSVPAVHATTLANSLTELKRARSTLHEGSDEVSLVYLKVVVEQMHRAQSQLELASAPTGKWPTEALAELRLDLALIAQHMARNILEAARRAGVPASGLAAAQDSLQRGASALGKAAYTTATVRFRDSLGFAADTITFDIRRFEDNIINAMAGEAVGYALSITFKGQTYNGGHADGLARTAADAPMTDQSPNKDMHVASVSKTVTAIVVLHVLEELGLTPDEPVAPYLPSDWMLGAGFADLKFRHFMRHETGFGQQEVSGSSYESLRALVAEEVVDSSFNYDNDNFALLRVAMAGLLGVDVVDHPDVAPDALTSALFLLQSHFLYNSIGVTVDCKATDPNPTIQYKFPDTGAAGYEEPDRSLTCGGVGWFINANELAGVMSTLRNSEQLMSAQMRARMQDEFLGLESPLNGYPGTTGDFGVYFLHGGEWNHGPGNLRACVIAFPIVVEAALLINSQLGTVASKCEVLRDAFDNAWVP